MIIDVIDEIETIKGLQRCYSLLVEDGEHRNYKPDPTVDLALVIQEKLEKLQALLNGHKCGVTVDD